MFILVPIICDTEQSETLRGLELPAEDFYEYKTGRINMALVTAYYPSGKEGQTYVEFGSGICMTVGIDFDNFDKIVMK